ncbi:hypothetical protein COP1_017844 [Malus domestica]
MWNGSFQEEEVERKISQISSHGTTRSSVFRRTKRGTERLVPFRPVYQTRSKNELNQILRLPNHRVHVHGAPQPRLRPAGASSCSHQLRNGDRSGNRLHAYDDSRSDLRCSKTSGFVHQHLASSVGNDINNYVDSLSSFHTTTMIKTKNQALFTGHLVEPELANNYFERAGLYCCKITELVFTLSTSLPSLWASAYAANQSLSSSPTTSPTASAFYWRSRRAKQAAGSTPTQEMINLLSALQKDIFTPRFYIAAATDNMSLQKARLLEENVDESSSSQFMQIYQSRKMGQSYFTSILNTLITLAHGSS